MRQQMDELMGKQRDDDANSQAKVQDFDDPNLDRFYLCGCSPYELLKGTKSEAMPQLDREGFLLERDEATKRRWEALTQTQRDEYGFEKDLMLLLQKLVDEQDRRIAGASRKYDAANNAVPEVNLSVVSDVEVLVDEIKELHAQCEVLGEQGEVDASLVAFKQANEKQQRLTELEKKIKPQNVKKHFVCTVSGLVYSSTDNEDRMAELQSGRQYRGWKQIRDKLEELKRRDPPSPGRHFRRSREWLRDTRGPGSFEQYDDGRERGYRDGERRNGNARMVYGAGDYDYDRVDPRNGRARYDYDRPW